MRQFGQKRQFGLCAQWAIVGVLVAGLTACGSDTDASASDASLSATDAAAADGTSGDGTSGDGTSSDGTSSDGTGGDATDEPAALPPLPTTALPWVGVWRSNFGSLETIGGLRWSVEAKDTPTSTTRVVHWDAKSGVIVVRFADDDPYTPGQFARVLVSQVGNGEIATCMVDYGKATAAEAIAATGSADDGDLDGKGCAGFPWTRLRRPEPAGLFLSAFGGNERFDADVMGWAKATSWDNAKRTAISQNAADDPYYPDAFNTIVWTEPKADGFAYCIVDFGLKTAELAAQSTLTADAGDVDGKGCGGFAWTRLAPIEVQGVWSSAFGGTEHIDGMGWTDARIVSFDNAKNTAILRSPADDPYTANQYAKAVWTEPKEGSFSFCFVAFGQKTAADAEQEPDTSDPKDLDSKGCGGFAWTKLSKP